MSLKSIIPRRRAERGPTASESAIITHTRLQALHQLQKLKLLEYFLAWPTLNIYRAPFSTCSSEVAGHFSPDFLHQFRTSGACEHKKFCNQYRKCLVRATYNSVAGRTDRAACKSFGFVIYVVSDSSGVMIGPKGNVVVTTW